MTVGLWKIWSELDCIIIIIFASHWAFRDHHIIQTYKKYPGCQLARPNPMYLYVFTGIRQREVALFCFKPFYDEIAYAVW